MERVWAELFLYDNSLFSFNGQIIIDENEDKLTDEKLFREMRIRSFAKIEDICTAISIMQPELYNSIESKFFKYIFEVLDINKYGLNNDKITADNIKNYYTDFISEKKNNVSFDFYKGSKENGFWLNPNVICYSNGTRDQLEQEIAREIKCDQSQVSAMLDCLFHAKFQRRHKYSHISIKREPSANTDTVEFVETPHYTDKSEQSFMCFSKEWNGKYWICFYMDSFYTINETINEHFMDTIRKVIQRNIISVNNCRNQCYLFSDDKLNLFKMEDFLKNDCKDEEIVNKIVIRNMIKTIETNFQIRQPNESNEFGSSTNVLLDKVISDIRAERDINFNMDIDLLSQTIHFERLKIKEKHRKSFIETQKLILNEHSTAF